MNKSAQTTMNMAVLALAFVSIIFSFVPMSDAETVTAGNFAVTWHDCIYGLTKQMCYVDIQNIDEILYLNPKNNKYELIAHDFNLSVVISDISYIDNYSTNMTIYLYEPRPVDTPIYETIEVNETRYNITYSQDNSTYTNETYYHIYNQTNQTGSETKMINQWEPTKSNMLKQGVREKMYYGTIIIPKYGGEPENDSNGVIYEENGTKRFKVEWTTPIIINKNGYGSMGNIKIMDEMSGDMYE